MNNKRVEKLELLGIKGDFFLFKLDNISSIEYENALPVLSPEEQKRASEYKSFKLNSEFAVGRSLLKDTLAKKLNLTPLDINFLYNDNGKPYLDNFPLHFNLSHSNQLALLGIAKQNIGVDIEYIDKDIEIEELLKIFAYQEEIKWVLEQNSLERFYNLWTVKESILKYQGIGITVPSFPKLEITNASTPSTEQKLKSLVLKRQHELKYQSSNLYYGIINESFAYSIYC